MTMQIKRDKFVIDSGGREADGTKVEPEAQVVRHVFEGVTPVGLGAGLDIAEGVGARGSIPLEIVAHGTAQTVARSVSALCGNCRYWDRVGWLKMLADNEGPGATQAQRHSINAIRAEILLHMPDAESHVDGSGDYDIEHAMKAMGLCHALAEFYEKKDNIREPHGTFQTSGCPLETVSPDKPFGLFEPKNEEAARVSKANYDAVMLRAAGKLLTP